MLRFCTGRYATVACAAAALLAGCGGAQMQAGGSAPSWMERDSTSQDLLYVTNGGAGAVRVFAYPSGKPAGTLTGLADPAGVCADAAGDVWIVESANSTLVQYAHGGKTQQATLQVSGAQNLLGCAVDPAGGDLAVADLGGPGGGGGVWIYSGAKGAPQNYKVSSMKAVDFCGYDDAGNLFVDGLDANAAFVFAELPKGSSAFRSIPLHRSVGFPGGVQWDGEHVAVGDRYYKGRHAAAIYRVTVTGSNGSVKGTTLLDGNCDALGFVVNGSSVVVPDPCQNDVRFYHYPAGGGSTKKILGFQYPAAAAISLANPDRSMGRARRLR